MLDLGPITVLAGANSGGKSSIFQSLLLLKQTLEGPPDVDLNLDGKYLQFSNFNDLIFGKPSLSRSSLRYEFEVESKIPHDVAPRYFPGINENDLVEGDRLRSTIDLNFRYKSRADEKRIVVNKFEVNSNFKGVNGPYLRGALTKGEYRTVIKGEGLRMPQTLRSRRIKTVELRHFLPYYVYYESDEESTHAPHRPLDPVFLQPFSEFRRDIQTRLKYLGPLRYRPRRAYLHSGSPLTEIGESGEFAAQVLWLDKDNEIEYLPEIGDDSVNISLMEAVNDAFVRLGMFRPVEVKAEKSVVYQLLFRLNESNKSSTVTIADVGFGVSQLLPIILLGLRAEQGSVLMFEQPEIHLHPRLQANLADFFLALAHQDLRVIVETHSDHLINRLRRRIAEDPTDQIKDKVNMLFVHPPTDANGATFERLRVDRYGVIENWPPEFLPESADEAEAIFAAGLKKRGA